MRGLGSNITKGIGQGSEIECIDNSGAKKLRVISPITYKGRRRRQAKAGVGDLVRCSVLKGSPKIRDEVPLAVIVRQRKEWKRPDGRRISFEDNAAILVNDRHEPRGNEIKGAIAREVVERFPAVGKIARIIV
ncbi:MAG: 50S ribosomal protein L14 [Candidatus Aenigmatarchaeota archaeon]